MGTRVRLRTLSLASGYQNIKSPTQAIYLFSCRPQGLGSSELEHFSAAYSRDETVHRLCEIEVFVSSVYVLFEFTPSRDPTSPQQERRKNFTTAVHRTHVLKQEHLNRLNGISGLTSNSTSDVDASDTSALSV